MKNIRVLVVDDSFFMRKMITDLIESSGIIKVVGTAKNGLEAIEKVNLLSPDIITLDVEMPLMDGLEALDIIMKENPLPVVMLSSLTQAGAQTTIRSLELGAFDFVSKPSSAGSFNLNSIKNELIDKILVAHKQSDIWLRKWNQTGRKSGIEERYRRIECVGVSPDESLQGIVAIGTSTGGPKALQEVITKFPRNFPYAILIVQHMPAGFTKSLANRLNDLAKITVYEALDGQLLEPGKAYLAPGNYHMVVDKVQGRYQIELNQNEPVKGHRPSVDIMFESLANIELKKIFVIMTGMGSDGTKGLKEAKNASDTLIVEDEKTCVVFGMPKAAINSGLADIVVPLHEISKSVISSVKNQRGCETWK